MGKEDEQDSETDTINSQDTGIPRRVENPLHPYWFDDETLRKSEIETLPIQEEIFWKELVEKYLYPIDEDKAEKVCILIYIFNNFLKHFFLVNPFTKAFEYNPIEFAFRQN